MVKPTGFFAQLKELARGGRSYWLVNLANFTDGIAYFGILNLLELYLNQEVKLSDAESGWMVGGFSACMTLFMLLMGTAVDRWGVRGSITIALFLSVLGRGGLALAADFADAPWRGAFVLTSLGIMALATGILQPALYAGVKYETRPHLTTMGFSLLYAIMNLGAVLESFVSPFIRTDIVVFGVRGANWGIRGVILCMVAITLLQLLIHWVLYPRTATAGKGGAVTAAEPSGNPLSALADLRFVFFIFILLPVRTLFAHQFLTVPSYITRCFGEETGHRLEWLQGLNSAVVTIGVPLLTHWTKHVTVLRMMIFGTALSALATFILSWPPAEERLVAYIIVFSLGEALWSSRFLEYVAELAPPGKVGAYMGAANLPWFMAKLLTSMYSGVMMAHFIPESGLKRPETLWTIYGFIACISPVGLMLAYGWLNRINTEPARVANEEPNTVGSSQSEEEP